MEFRKISENKGSFSVRLPRDWVTRNRLEKGGYVRVEETKEGNIEITIAK